MKNFNLITKPFISHTNTIPDGCFSIFTLPIQLTEDQVNKVKSKRVVKLNKAQVAYIEQKRLNRVDIKTGIRALGSTHTSLYSYEPIKVTDPESVVKTLTELCTSRNDIFTIVSNKNGEYQIVLASKFNVPQKLSVFYTKPIMSSSHPFLLFSLVFDNHLNPKTVEDDSHAVLTLRAMLNHEFSQGRRLEGTTKIIVDISAADLVHVTSSVVKVVTQFNIRAGLPIERCSLSVTYV
ncbi:hypothetical protein REH76_02840 [Photobacterium damselae]